jgi:uncharacterized protein YbaA (DUF1428 family)
MPYVDGFLLAIPRRKVDLYRKIARKASKLFRKHGAIEYRECLGDDLKNTMGVSFTRAARCRKGEVPVFSWIVYKSRAHRDRVNKKIMKDPAMLAMMEISQPFDMKRMAYGGFRVIVDA